MLFGTNRVPVTSSRALNFNSFNPHKQSLRSLLFLASFYKRETEAQRGEMSCLKPPGGRNKELLSWEINLSAVYHAFVREASEITHL